MRRRGGSSWLAPGLTGLVALAMLGLAFNPGWRVRTVLVGTTGGSSSPAHSQVLAECGRGGACPGLALALKNAGLTTPAEAKWVAKMPVEGFKASTQSLFQVASAHLAADERIAEDTVKMLKAEESLKIDLAKSGRHSLPVAIQAAASDAMRRGQQQLHGTPVAATGIPAQPGVMVGGVELSGREITGIIKRTMARLKVKMAPTFNYYQDAGMLAATNGTNSTEEDDNPFPQGNGGLFDWLYDQVLDSDELPATKINYNQMPDRMTTDQLKNVSEAPEGSLTLQAGEGTYDEMGVEKPYLAIPETQDVAIARATPRWAKKGYKGDPFFEMERMGEYDSHKPKWKSLVYGGAANYMKDTYGYPTDKWVPLTVARNQINPHTGFQPLDRFPKVDGAGFSPTNSTEMAEGEGMHEVLKHNYRSAAEDADPMHDPRSDKEKRLLFGDTGVFWNEPWKRSHPFTLADKRVKVDANDEVSIKRFFETGTGKRGDGGFEPRLHLPASQEE